jgi:hypothetical protein
MDHRGPFHGVKALGLARGISICIIGNESLRLKYSVNIKRRYSPDARDRGIRPFLEATQQRARRVVNNFW